MAVGRVLSVNVSAGGVPKVPLEGAVMVSLLGVDGDGHRERTLHGGPHRAVCLFAREAIDRVAAEGHPIFPGSCGENLTTEGIELSTLPVGTRLAIGGAGLVLELSAADGPCATIAGSFADRRFARISILDYPTDSRMYARVLSEGAVRAGDAIRVLPPVDGSLAARHLLLARLDGAERSFALGTWRAGIEGGLDIKVLASGELAVAATPGVVDDNFNVAYGLRQVPHLLPDVLEFFRANGVAGAIETADPPWPGAVAERYGSIVAARPDAVAEAPSVPGLTIRPVSSDEATALQEIVIDAFGETGAIADAWRAVGPRIARHPGMHLVCAELGGRAVGAAGLFVHHAVGVLGPAGVLPEARGRGIQRALIAFRARLAAQLECEHVTAQAALDGASDRNLRAMGLERVWVRGIYRSDPAAAGLG
ncbi:MAG TPA: GNAT family N-acetyltransferase [Candidatus Limnocylindrales bacterium]